MSRAPLTFGARLGLLALAAGLLRLAPAALVHLTEDESYYRIWAQHLQLGYYDHPPMIAWWIWLGQRICGDTALGVRLLPTLSAGATTWLLGDLARRLGGSERIAFRAALWWNATFTVALGGMLAIPDAPTCFFWILSLWCLARAGEGEGRGGWWLAAGAAAGLGLLSKYSTLFLAPGILLWLLLDPQRRPELRTPWPWLAALLAAAVFSPNVVWNAQNHWLTFAKQFGRAAPSPLRPAGLPEFLLAQAFLLNPIIAVFAARGVASALRAERRLLLPATSALPFLGYLVIHSLHARVQGHWPVPVYAPLALCAAVAAGEGGRWSRLASGLGIGVGALALVHMSVPRAGSLGVVDPALPLAGWDRFADDVEALRQREGAAWVGTLNYGLHAQLVGEGRVRAPVLQVSERARYRLDEGPRPDFTRPGLLIDLDRRMDRADVLRCFAVVEPVGVLERGFEAGPVQRYAAFRVAQPRRDVWADGCHMRNEVLPGF
ncbi:ArnT family glycosyltransferase [Phenylobacterium soli]|uniref:Glycosyl transferase family 39 n=1 Tax=Phenylobacterium soli TaxID=2170551 RepID=A0A328ALR4_9CAUL|nr:glycosyltransferase family 39 protein [Phenylobacterium soli]RAK55539.1 glycosyl transferase family 39 [Phenylobacterium soli]